MEKDSQKYKIKIIKNGPYRVTGNVPLSEKIIVPKGEGYEFKEGKNFPATAEYHLCRCGKSKNHPFCDGSHVKAQFKGTETASREKYQDRAQLFEGPGLDILDDKRCAFGRFCHTEKGMVWDLIKDTDQEECKEMAIKGASECFAGRLTAVDKTGRLIEPEYEPAIEILQDSEKGVSGGLFVKGNIPIEGADGEVYEIRNRVALCRCGESRNKPFCDATHVAIKFIDE